MQTPFLFFFIFSVAALTLATYTDLRKRIVSNKLTYAMVAVGLLGHLGWAAAEASPVIFFNSAAATVATFLGAMLLYRIGAWAGGDVKLFTGIAALNPLNPNLLNGLGILQVPQFQSIGLPIFPLTLFIFSIIAMLPYGIFIALLRLNRNKEQAKKIFAGFKLFAAGFAVVLALFLAALLSGQESVAGLLILILAGWSALFLLRLYVLSKVLMRKTVRISELQEGMIVGETIVENRGKVERREEGGIKRLINQFVANKSRQEMQSKEREIVASWRAGGVTKQEARELQKLVKSKKLQDAIEIKESAPFVPAVLIAYLALNLVGDFIWQAFI